MRNDFGLGDVAWELNCRNCGLDGVAPDWSVQVFSTGAFLGAFKRCSGPLQNGFCEEWRIDHDLAPLGGQPLRLRSGQAEAAVSTWVLLVSYGTNAVAIEEQSFYFAVVAL